MSSATARSLPVSSRRGMIRAPGCDLFDGVRGTHADDWVIHGEAFKNVRKMRGVSQDVVDNFIRTADGAAVAARQFFQERMHCKLAANAADDKIEARIIRVLRSWIRGGPRLPRRAR